MAIAMSRFIRALFLTNLTLDIYNYLSRIKKQYLKNRTTTHSNQ
jgi:hypothetical protein